MKKENGITLVALIITIIVLLILAVVSINLVINGGILDKAKYAVDKYSEGEIGEQIKLAYLEWQTAGLTGTTENANDFIKNRLNSSIGNIKEVSVDGNAITVTVIKNGEDKTYYYNVQKGIVKEIELAKNSTDKKDSYVGCYADIDEDGTVDGVIFVDLLTGSIRDTQQWGSNNTTYVLPTNVTTNNVNTYYISQGSYTDAKFGTHSVISPKGANGEKRFYIMQLSNFTTPAYTDENDSTKNYPAYSVYTWYANASGKMSPSITTNAFGEGKENTRKMIEKWNAAGTTDGYTDAAQDNRDIWKHIQTKYNEGWFIPSTEEWTAFLNELGITGASSGNYSSTYGLSLQYWTSSQYNTLRAWHASLYWGRMYYPDVSTAGHSIRLTTTF